MALANVAVAPQSIRAVIRNEIEFDPKANDLRIARRVMDAVSKDDLLPLVLDAVGNARREQTRKYERTILPALRPITPTVVVPDRKKRLLDAFQPKDFYAFRRAKLDLGDGTSVRWGQATKEQLLMRRAMLSRQESGIRETISLIDRAIAELDEAGVSCLDELQY